ncbi:MAG: TolC family protein [Cytophagaceae bacterium]
MKKLILFLILLIPALNVNAQDTLSLQDAIRMALENNFSIRLMKNEVEIAKNNNTIANAGMLPSLSATGSQDNSITTTEQKFFDGRTRNASNAGTHSLNAGVMMDWTIFQGYSMFIAKNTLEQLQQVGELQQRLTIENTVASVIISYYDIVAQNMRKKVLTDAVNLGKERKNLVEYMMQLGSASRPDVFQVSVDLNNDSASLLQQNILINNLKSNFNVLLGREGDVSFETELEIPIEKSLQYDQLLTKVEQQNTRLFLARRNIHLADLNTRFWKSQYYPRVSLYGGYNYLQSRSEVGLLQSNLNFGPTYGVRATFNIFNGFTNKRNLNNSKILQQSSELELRQVQLEIRNDLLKLYNTYIGNLELMKLQQENLIMARENLNISVEKFRLGSINNIDLRIIQQNLINAETKYLEARYEAKVAETELMRLAGEIN